MGGSIGGAMGVHARLEVSPPPLIGAVTGLAAAGGLIGASYAGRTALAVAVLVLQVVLALGWLALVDVPGDLSGFVVVAAVALSADAVLVSHGGAQIGDLAQVIAIALPGSLLAQLLRRDRREVTATLTAILMLVVLTAAAATFIGLRGGRGGEEATVAALIGLGVAVAAGRLVDGFVARPRLAPGARRGLPGLIAAVVAGTTASALYGATTVMLRSGRGAVIGLVVAVIAVAADAGVDLGAIELAPKSTRQREAVDPVAALLPFALAAPAAYVVARFLLG